MAVKIATPKQIDFITKLANEKDYSSGQLDRVVVHHEEIGRETASTLIDLLLRAPRKAATPATHELDNAVNPGAWKERTAPDAALTPGMYKLDGIVYQVRPNRQKTRLYAKHLIEINADRITESDEIVQIEFEYERGAVFNLREEHRMGLEEGKALCIRYGRCICCNRVLKAATSVERGIGPVCIKYFA